MSGPRPDPRPAILAVDGGNSKADVAILAADGSVIGAVRGPTVSHQAVGLAHGLATLEASVGHALAQGGLDPGLRPVAPLGLFALAGADLAADVRLLKAGLRDRGLSGEVIVRNDTHAALRAGTDRTWGVVVVCGAGINGLGIGPTGRIVRFAAVGEYAGDRGAGSGVAMATLAAAIRGRDGRGPRTILERLVPEALERRRPGDLTIALYRGRLDESRLREVLPPVVFGAAADGDAVAAAILDDLADEIVAWAVAMIRRLHVIRRDVHVVLSGGIFRTTYRPFLDRIEDRIHEIAPRARIRPLAAPPVAGAALLGLDRLDLAAEAREAAERRLRTELTFDRLGVA